ncbi:hypothetical protein [Brevibacterium aurantiacum]|uniref:Uncharacterized protein n=1 Tax=Brevibacterium aurantiacum TaxID=273384 RepID=A0A2H1JZY9_BREAU|nr:hypothetical protein [Brevibacterium aurantiacum]GEB21950.1 hypothetical protein BAU01nite_06830 [Brevibacterium aurantiacum]SMX93033.1 hypothetical protein BAUR9175_02978 [Brevibacterium aurantiacum]
MARSYGFRVFIVEAYPNRIKDREPYNAESGGGIAKEISLLLERLENKGTQRFEARPDQNGNVTKPLKTATLTSSQVVSPSLIHAQIATGEEGSHASATKPRATTRDLEGWSAEASHQVTFVFPKGKDSRFLLVTQTNYRRDPHARLLAMIRDESKLIRSEREDEEAANRNEARKAGEKIPKKKAFKRLLFDEHQASDNEYLDELLTGADRASVTFKSKRLDATGHNDYVDRVLTIKLRDQNIIDVGRQAGRSWVTRRRSQENTTQKQAVSEVASLLEERDLFGDGEEDRYQSTSIALHGKESDATTTIAVDTLRDAFTYPLSDLPPSIHSYYARVCDRASRVARQEGIELEIIDPDEVIRCLTDSTPVAL